MDYIFIFNGLGNQMSQYALYLAKKAKGQEVDYICRNTDHNGIELERLFGIDCRRSFKKWYVARVRSILMTRGFLVRALFLKHLFRSRGCSIYCENGDYRVQKPVLEEGEGTRFFYGGWHKEDYFASIANIVRSTFQFPAFTDEHNIAIAKASLSEKAVAIHIRKGDYMCPQLLRIFGTVCTDAYYENALLEMEKRIQNPHFYVFSNDIKEAQRILGDRVATFVDWNKKKNSWQDMALMSLFRNIIIANSTFSWWAAWLGEEKGKFVIRPPFFINNDPKSDIYPSRWHVVDN